MVTSEMVAQHQVKSESWVGILNLERMVQEVRIERIFQARFTYHTIDTFF